MIFSGEDAAFGIDMFLETEANLQSREFCVNWLEGYIESGGDAAWILDECAGKKDWKEMPYKDIRKAVELIMAIRISETLREAECLH